jgi:hypothetical protein
MAYNYINLVNEVNRRLNEVELTEANFANARGYHGHSKDAVNSAVRHINQEEFEWPWNHVEAEEVLTAGVVRYSIPYDAKTVNMNSFRIKGDADLGVATTKLKVLNYEEYLDNYADYEYNSSNSVRGVPRYVVRAPSNEFILVPAADKDYELVYEYYTVSYDMQLTTDTPTIPEQYKHVIADGAMYYAYMFRGDAQAAGITQGKFTDGIKYMRSLHINRTEYIRDTRVKR